MELSPHPSHPSKQPLLAGASPKLTFLFGIVSGIAALEFAALVVLLPKVGASSVKQGSSTTPVTAVAPTAPSAAPTDPTPSPAAITVAAVTKDDHIRGDLNAPVKIVEYSDLECPFCKRFHPTMQQVVQEYGNKVAWVYRHFPLDSLHSKARKEAEATECANDQGGNDAFWKYTDRIFEVTPSNDGLDLTQLPQIAQDIGLNRSKFEECLNGGKFASHVAQDLADANSAGGNGTPYTVVLAKNGDKIPVSGAVPFSQLKTAIDRALQ